VVLLAYLQRHSQRPLDPRRYPEIRTDATKSFREPRGRLSRDGIAARTIAAPHGTHLTCVPALREAARRGRCECVHAWDALAAITARTATPLPLVVSLEHPAEADRIGRWYRSLESTQRLVFACPTEIVRRRLVEHGVPIELTVVVRPGVDFGRINAADAAEVRDALEIGDAGPIVVTDGPPDAEDGQFEVVWAVALLQQIWPNITLLMPGCSRESERLQRFVESFKLPDILRCKEDRFALWTLLRCAEACVIGGRRDRPATMLAWAMAAGVPIVAPAIHSVAELVADRQNGLLCKYGEPRMIAARLMNLLDDLPAGRRFAETARGQAFDVFGKRRFVDQIHRLYDNVLAGRSAGDEIRDAALTA